MKKIHLRTALVLSLFYLVIGVVTLPDYGINWDTINHLPRGQAYLHYFLTGKHDYSDLAKWELYWQNPESLSIDTDIPGNKVAGRSYYQSDSNPFDWYMQHDGNGHPPLSDILSSVFNRVLFGKLRIINDIDAYRVYGVFLAACLVGLIYYWMATNYGFWTGIIAGISLATYPLFWSESHFNTEKDIPETVYWSFLMFAIWKGITRRSVKWILLSGLFFGLALGTKFNILFAAFVILPWLLVYWLGSYGQKKRRAKFWKENRKVIVAGFLALSAGILIFIGSWPYLWPDILNRTYEVFKFYKTIGVTSNINPRFVGKWLINTYPLYWIVYTTYVPVLILVGLGVIEVLKSGMKEKSKLMILFLLWLMVPVGRVMVPKATVYGGIRQIMEYVPAMAILAGLGAKLIIERSKKKAKSLVGSLLILMFLPHVYRLAEIHPNENVYFNSLIGGLAGAKKHDLPSWGNTFGAAYRQGVAWIDKNAEENANVVYAFELIPNIPRIQFRQDLTVWNKNRSGYLRQGEYAISLTYDGTAERSYYDMYLEKFIEPAFVVEVDGVSILKVWKNSDEYLKVPWVEKDVGAVWERSEREVVFDIGEVENLARLEFSFDEENCRPLNWAYVRISVDGKVWVRLPGGFPRDWLIPAIGKQPNEGKFMEPFVGQEARYVEIVMDPKDACLSNVIEAKVFSLQ